jgi:hypothetical protein
MVLAQSSIGTLLDLIQARLLSMEIADREDRRERRHLQACLEELRNMLTLNQPQSAEEASAINVHPGS